jgi:hypothetical protein
MKLKNWLGIAALSLAAFTAGRFTYPTTAVHADSPDSPQVELRPVGGDSSLVVYYPKLNKVFIYQTPLIGAPKWGCSYSIQLGAPGGTVERQQCPMQPSQF